MKTATTTKTARKNNVAVGAHRALVATKTVLLQSLRMGRDIATDPTVLGMYDRHIAAVRVELAALGC